MLTRVTIPMGAGSENAPPPVVIAWDCDVCGSRMTQDEEPTACETCAARAAEQAPKAEESPNA